MSTIQSATLLAICMACSPACHAAQPEAVLYSFTGGADEGFPQASVIADASGNLYGTTDNPYRAQYRGTVFRLARPAAGGAAWTETVLHSFGGGTDGLDPAGALALDSAGNLYGATSSGGAFGYGTIYRLTPPAPRQAGWTETILHSFSLTDGAAPNGGLILGRQGMLFGTASSSMGAGSLPGPGLVFALRPPAAGQAAWTEQILHRFSIDASGLGPDGAFPRAGVVADRHGNLFGATYAGGPVIAGPGGSTRYEGAGVVYELSPPAAGQTGWTETVLYDFSAPLDGFNPDGGVALDASGAVYGTTANATHAQGSGVVFKLTPPVAGPGNWTETLVLNDQSPGDPYGFYGASPLIDRSGGIVVPASAGGREGRGAILHLAPPATGQLPWMETFFSFSGKDGSSPEAGLTKAGHDRQLYGTTAEGGAHNRGTVFSIAP